MIEKSIVKLDRRDLKVSSWDLSIKMGVEHRMLTRTLEKYMDDFVNDLNFVASQRQQIEGEKRGRRAQEYILTELQALYLLTLLTNLPEVRKFKLWLSKEFFKQRKLINKIIIQKENSEWLERRESGKVERRIETDHIQAFCEYARVQGSKNYKTYYMNFTKMQYQTLFPEKYTLNPGLKMRDLLDRRELGTIETSDLIVAQTISQSMKLELPYKEIFAISKVKTEGLALSLGITPFRMMIKEKDKKCQLT